MAAKGVLSRIAGSLVKFISGQEKVGNGPLGSAYYRMMSKNDRGEPIEKRWVKFPRSLGHGFYDPSAIPPEWGQWLNRVRVEPPTDGDITKAAARRELIRGKAAMLQADEAKRKFQAEYLGQQSGPNRDAFVRQLTEPGLVRGGGKASVRSPMQEAPSAPPPPEADTPPAAAEKQRGTTKQAFQPDTWRPGA